MTGKIFKIFMLWCIFFGSAALIKSYIIPTGYVSASTNLDVSVINTDYHSCTVAVHQIQDYYFEYNSSGLINVTPIGRPRILDNYSSDICKSG